MEIDKQVEPTLEEKDAGKQTIDAAETSAQFELTAQRDAAEARSSAKDSRDLARNPVI